MLARSACSAPAMSMAGVYEATRPKLLYCTIEGRHWGIFEQLASLTFASSMKYGKGPMSPKRHSCTVAPQTLARLSDVQ
jgi:hypothetical protein